MKKLFSIANQYVQESNWKDLALLKFCLCSMGVLIGTQITPKHKKSAILLLVFVFIATYIPLITKFFAIVLHNNHSEKL